MSLGAAADFLLSGLTIPRGTSIMALLMVPGFLYGVEDTLYFL